VFVCKVKSGTWQARKAERQEGGRIEIVEDSVDETVPLMDTVDDCSWCA
jgi:hypothetical protein